MTLVYFILGLSILIFIHEMGHFVTAKLFHVYVYEFSLFMGPLLYQKKVGETRYSIRALPIGGYVSMAGENDQQQARNEEELATEDETPPIPMERTLNGIQPWKKFLVLFSGAALNLVLSFVFLVIAFLGNGVVEASSRIRVVEDSLFAQADIRSDDVITALRLSGEESFTLVESFDEVSQYIATINLASGLMVGSTQCLDLVIERDGETQPTKQVCRTLTEYEVEIQNEQRVLTKIAPIYGFSQTSRMVGFGEALAISAQTEWQMGGLIFNALGSLFQPGGLENVSGPVGMYEAAADFAAAGFYSFIFYLAMISVNLGIINLLPFPALDGGRLFVIAIEGITRKKVSPKVEGFINSIGFLVLIGFIIVITIKDIFFA